MKSSRVEITTGTSPTSYHKKQTDLVNVIYSQLEWIFIGWFKYWETKIEKIYKTSALPPFPRFYHFYLCSKHLSCLTVRLHFRQLSYPLVITAGYSQSFQECSEWHRSESVCSSFSPSFSLFLYFVHKSALYTSVYSGCNWYGMDLREGSIPSKGHTCSCMGNSSFVGVFSLPQSTCNSSDVFVTSVPLCSLLSLTYPALSHVCSHRHQQLGWYTQLCSSVGLLL